MDLCRISTRRGARRRRRDPLPPPVIGEYAQRDVRAVRLRMAKIWPIIKFASSPTFVPHLVGVASD
jgi:hypothetical protein